MLRIASLSLQGRCGARSQQLLAGARRTTLSLPRTTRRQQSSSPVVVVSRRKWNEYLQKSAPKLKASETVTAAKPDEKPWPRSVRWTGAFLAATLIPYTVVWICLTNESTRPLILNNCGPSLEAILREHFGEKDINQVSYVDRRQGGQPAPKKFLGEASQSVREQQQRIESDLQKPLKVRAKLRSPDSDLTMAEAEVQVPASAWARKEDLVTKFSSVDKSTAQTAALVLEFPVEKQNSDTLMQDELSTEPQQEAPEIDPLREKARVYSLWHYQPAAPQQAPAAAASRSNMMSHEEIEAERLRHGIARLEEELKSSSRPIDDITEELQRSKADLRRLQWKKWVPWS